ncbi:hypothetical protein GALMADRAFT_138599 [Galerina marginata CBS 339.88]|uniref:Uncharacterized protein n=1 Tax=Galerina marginata (strain CBS 339.88) TaxID=685588 RepID=A0A067T311_GALM3|nr:hypothetical protein GALMADRAFT_138599 [Galerina marginata CBS 339.88]
MVLFALCTCYICGDFASEFIIIFRSTSQKGQLAVTGLTVAGDILYSFIDVISQGVLIYRCWIMWDRNRLFIILPSILAITSFALAITLSIQTGISGAGAFPNWFFKLGVGSFSISLCVNAVVTSLLVLKIVRLHRELASGGPRTRGMYELRPLISIIIESGMFTLVAQTLWVVFVQLESDGNPGFGAIIGPTTMIYGITPTLVLVRAAAGRSYNPTVVESTIEFSPRRENADNAVASVNLSQSSKTLNVTQSVPSEYDAEKTVL